MVVDVRILMDSVLQPESDGAEVLQRDSFIQQKHLLTRPSRFIKTQIHEAEFCAVNRHDSDTSEKLLALLFKDLRARCIVGNHCPYHNRNVHETLSDNRRGDKRLK